MLILDSGLTESWESGSDFSQVCDLCREVLMLILDSGLTESFESGSESSQVLGTMQVLKEGKRMWAKLCM
jgi:hypothetical protein